MLRGAHQPVNADDENGGNPLQADGRHKEQLHASATLTYMPLMHITSEGDCLAYDLSAAAAALTSQSANMSCPKSATRKWALVPAPGVRSPHFPTPWQQ